MENESILVIFARRITWEKLQIGYRNLKKLRLILKLVAINIEGFKGLSELRKNFREMCWPTPLYFFDFFINNPDIRVDTLTPIEEMLIDRFIYIGQRNRKG